jgi:DNA polymerase
MNKIIIDFETYSEIDIKEAGAHVYAMHPSTRIICMSYKINDNLTNIWLPSHNWPKDLEEALNEDFRLYSFNGTFEMLIINYVGIRDFPEFFTVMKSINKMTDIEAICARYKLPRSLDKAAKALNCNAEKMTTGKKLIRICCTPGHNPTKRDYENLYTYCIIDTDVAYEILQKLPVDFLTDEEQKLWELTYEINLLGVPIDIEAVNAIVTYLNIYMEQMKIVLPDVTNGFVQTPGQVQKIKKYCELQGIILPNLQAETVTKFLSQEDLPDSVRTVLEMRQLLGRTSIAKFITLKEMNNNGWVHGNLMYYGAGTGRWAGRGFQYHNLPRAKCKSPEEAEELIKKFKNRDPIEKPVEAAVKLIRSMITAPEGYLLIVSDYSSIENRILSWLCDDYETLDLFEKNICQYKDMAAFLYIKPIEEITADERMMGKVIILGCGYQMGAVRFKQVAEGFGIFLSTSEAELIVKAYRAKYYKIAKMWSQYNEAAKAAVIYKGNTYKSNKALFRTVTDKTGKDWLRIVLPSGRSLMYAEPKVEEYKYGSVVTYWGLNATTYQMTRTALTPGVITENIDQATARDYLAHGMLNLVDKFPEVKICISVHDEIGGLIPIDLATPENLEKFNNIICEPPEWAENLPMKAEGYFAKRYRKD